MKYLDDRHNRLLSFRGKLYHPGHQDSPVKQNIAEKMAGSGLQYSDLKNLFQRFGRKGLVCILSKPPLSARSSAPRVTRTTTIVLAIVKHFEEISNNSTSQWVLNQYLSRKFVPFREEPEVTFISFVQSSFDFFAHDHVYIIRSRGTRVCAWLGISRMLK